MPLLQVAMVLIVVGVLLWLGQPLHTDAGNDQVDPECSRGHRCGVVASECVRASS